MDILCKNCQNVFKGHYCNICGQSAKTRRIDSLFLLEDIEHGILHYDKGIGYSLKRLYKKPGIEIRNYISGKRVGHFRPISLAIILATVYALIYHFLGVTIINSDNKESIMHLERIIKYYSWYVFFTIPVFAFATKIAFHVKKYNFSELIIFEAFKSTQRLLIHILFLPLFYILASNPKLITVTNYVLILIDLALILWTNIQFFNHKKRVVVLGSTFFAYLIYIVCIFTLLVLIIVISNYFSIVLL